MFRYHKFNRPKMIKGFNHPKNRAMPNRHEPYVKWSQRINLCYNYIQHYRLHHINNKTMLIFMSTPERLQINIEKFLLQQWT